MCVFGGLGPRSAAVQRHCVRGSAFRIVWTIFEPTAKDVLVEERLVSMPCFHFHSAKLFDSNLSASGTAQFWRSAGGDSELLGSRGAAASVCVAKLQVPVYRKGVSVEQNGNMALSEADVGVVTGHLALL